MDFFTYTDGLDTPWAILKALEQRLAPTERARRLELSREYRALQKVPKSQSLDKYFQLWETTYAECEKINLPEIQDHAAICDFVTMIKTLEPAYWGAYEVNLNDKIDARINVPTLYEAVEKFQNSLCLSQASSKAASHTAFATLQGEAPSNGASKGRANGSPQSKQAKACLRGEMHRFSECPYLIKQKRPAGWTPNEQTKNTIDEKIANSERLKETVDSYKKSADEKEKTRRSSDARSKQAPQSTATSFAVTRTINKLRDS